MKIEIFTAYDGLAFSAWRWESHGRSILSSRPRIVMVSPDLNNPRGPNGPKIANQISYIRSSPMPTLASIKCSSTSVYKRTTSCIANKQNSHHQPDETHVRRKPASQSSGIRCLRALQNARCCGSRPRNQTTRETISPEPSRRTVLRL